MRILLTALTALMLFATSAVADGDYGIFFAGEAVKVFIAALVIVVALQLLASLFGYRRGAVGDPD